MLLVVSCRRFWKEQTSGAGAPGPSGGLGSRRACARRAAFLRGLGSLVHVAPTGLSGGVGLARRGGSTVAAAHLHFPPGRRRVGGASPG